MTMSQLARLAGVSVSTVSKAFSGSKEVSAEQRERIFQLARENGCYEKYCKAVFDKPVIAVLCPEFQSGYYTQQLDFFSREIKKRGGVMLTDSYDFDKNYQGKLLEYFAECVKVDGIILYNLFQGRTAYNTPMVVIGESDAYDAVSLSVNRAICEAVESFAKHGHKAIAFIGDKFTARKCKAFECAMEQQGLTVDETYLMYAQKRFEIGGYEAMNALLAMPQPPTAVLAAYDGLAIGAMRSIREHGLSVPEDISIIGMDDSKMCAYMEVPLSSITSYNEELCEIIIDTLFERIDNGQSGQMKSIKVSSQLVQRASVGPVKKQKGNVKKVPKTDKDLTC